MGNTPSKNAISSAAVTPDGGAGSSSTSSSLSAPTEDGNEGICSGSSGKKNMNRGGDAKSNQNDGVKRDDKSTPVTLCNHPPPPFSTAADFSYQSSLATLGTMATLSSSESSVASSATTTSSLSLYSQGFSPQFKSSDFKSSDFKSSDFKSSEFKPSDFKVHEPKKPKKQHAVDVNELIQRLLDAGVTPTSSSKNASSKLCISNNEIVGICRAARQVFLSQPTLLELGTPVQVVGDIHGQYGDLMRVFQTCGMPPYSNYLFLGDYVDRGKQSIETILLLFCFKIRYPENVFLLRGNHESASVTKVYGFYDECKRRASVKVWKSFVDTFNTLPIAATIGGKIFCVHGGLSPYLNSLDDIRTIQRPTDIPDVGLLSDLLWSDPDSSVAEWSPNDRGISYCFGRSVVDKFCAQFNFDLVARGHMVVEDGYEFFDNRKLVTVFSAPNYCGEFGNWAAVMSVGKDLLCRFELLKPLDTNGVRKALKDSVFVGKINTTQATKLKHRG